MGSWSVKLYGSDDAADLKATFSDAKRIPGSIADLVALVVGRHADMGEPDSEGYCDLWLALRDQLHAHGLDHPETAERAKHIITSGADISMKRALEMSERDLVKRQAELDALLAKWSVPEPKPKLRNVYKAPEPHIFAEGEIVAYASSRGEPANPWLRNPEDWRGWRQDGWGSFIVLKCGYQLGYVA